MKNNKLNSNILSLSVAGALMTLAPACGDSDGDTGSGTGSGSGAVNTTAPTTAGTNTTPTTAGTNTGPGTSGTMTPGDTTGTAPAPACANPADNSKRVLVNAPITAHTTWTCDKIYVLQDLIFVKNATLTIQPGTLILGIPQAGAPTAALVVEKSAKLMAKGTADKPIVFTSGKPTGQKTRGDWGGIVLLGEAKTNAEGGTKQAEGFKDNAPSYGGQKDDHNCGTLQYVRVEWAGKSITPGKELNAITFYSCGSQTVVDHVQTHMGLDDGFEWFGGNFNASHLISTGSADDSFDIDEGFRGNLQFLFVHQDPAVGDSGFEISNSGDREDAVPVTRPVIANATYVGAAQAAKEATVGLILKQGTELGLHNSIVVEPKVSLINLINTSTETKFNGGQVSITGDIFKTAASPAFTVGDPKKGPQGETFTPATLETWIKDATRNNKVGEDPMLPSPAWGNPNIKPAPGGITSTAAIQLPAGFVATTYVGAVDPAAAEDWTKASWVNYSVQ